MSEPERSGHVMQSPAAAAKRRARAPVAGSVQPAPRARREWHECGNRGVKKRPRQTCMHGSHDDAGRSALDAEMAPEANAPSGVAPSKEQDSIPNFRLPTERE